VTGPLPHQTPTVRAERADKARNHARIIAAASAAFAVTGSDTQMDDIAARAGLGVGTLYRHFATKDALMVAMARRTFMRVLAASQAALEHPGEPFEVLKNAIRAGAEVTAEDAVTRDALMRTDGVWQGVTDIIDELEATMQVLMRRAQAAGTLRKDVSAADVPMLMSGVCTSMGAPDWNWRRHLEILLDGLAPPGGSDTGAPRAV
jgi:AcrR family transcriptional regulator